MDPEGRVIPKRKRKWYHVPTGYIKFEKLRTKKRHAGGGVDAQDGDDNETVAGRAKKTSA